MEDSALTIEPDRPDGLEELFRARERLLWGLCYRLTGCAADADDIVQETFARAVERLPAQESLPRAWLVRVAVNLSLDVLRRRRRRGYTGSWLPSPVDSAALQTELLDEGHSPEARYERLESVSYAFLLALEALTPRQRAALLLRDVFDYSAREAAVVLGMSEENVRITHLRARRAMAAYDRRRRRPKRALEEQTRRALGQFVRCLLAQDAAGLEALLAESVRTVTDGGGVYTALHGPLVGRAKVLQLHLRVARRRAPGTRVHPVSLNGLPAVLIEYGSAARREAPRAALRCELDEEGRIAELHVVLAPRKLTAVPLGSP
jgi:RNA polymerase sigma-70 factor (ECF subfamily)